TLYLNFWRMKPRKVRKEIQHYVDELNKDGILVIPDFFSKEQFDEIKKEFDESYRGWSPFEFNKEDFSKRQKDFPAYFETIAEKIVTPETSAFTKYFVNNALINEITSAIVHRESRLKPHHHFWYLQRRTLENKNAGNLHSAAFPH